MRSKFTKAKAGWRKKSSATGGSLAVEGERTDRQSVCLYCWKLHALCEGSSTLRCILCLQSVAADDLDAHTRSLHPKLEVGVFTCQGRSVSTPLRNGVLGHKIPDQDVYKCNLCIQVFDAARRLREHLVSEHKVISTSASLSQIACCNHCLTFFGSMTLAIDHRSFCRESTLATLPYCEECNERFASPTMQRRHMKAVHMVTKKTNLDCYVEAMAFNSKV